MSSTESSRDAVKPSSDAVRLALTANVFAGGFLGLFIGLIVGLTTSGLAATVAATLVALLATFLGLKDEVRHFVSTKHLFRIGAFALGASLGALTGVAARANHWLAPSFEQLVQEAERFEQLKPTSKELVAQARYGMSIKDGTMESTDQTKGLLGVLYSDQPTDADCTLLKNSSATPYEERMRLLSARKGALSSLATALEKMPPEDRQNLLNAAPFYVCGF